MRSIVKMKWVIAIWTLLGWSVYPVTGANIWAAQTERLKKDLAEKKAEFNEIKKKIHLKKKEKEDIARKEYLLRESIEKMQQHLIKQKKGLKQKRAGFDQITRIILDKESQISTLARNLRQTEQKFGSALEAFYKISQPAPEMHLFSISDPSDLLRTDKYLCVLINHYALVTKAYEHKLATYRSDKRELVENRTQINQSIFEEEKKKAKIAKLRNVEQNRLKSTVIQKQLTRSRLQRWKREKR